MLISSLLVILTCHRHVFALATTWPALSIGEAVVYDDVY